MTWSNLLVAKVTTNFEISSIVISTSYLLFWNDRHSKMFPTLFLLQQKIISYLAVVSLCCESSGTCSFVTEKETNTNKTSTKKQSDITNVSAAVIFDVLHIS